MRSALGLLFLAATVLAECPDGWEKFGHNCYKVTDDPSVNSLDKHLANCRRQGGSLASIHSQEQQDFIESLVQNHSPNTVYLGLYDAFKNGTWVWSDGTPVDYENWDEGRPDNTDGSQFCSQLHGDRDGVWDDEDCCGNGLDICQIPDPDACPCPRNWTHLPQTGFCYKLDYNGTNGPLGTITPRNWTAARNSCLEQGGDLVSVHSRAEQAALYAIAGAVVDINYENSIFIGLNINGTPPAWRWSDGTPFDVNYFIQLDNPNSPYAAFVPRYAGNAVNGQTAGGWHDITGTFLYKYAICKQKAYDLPAQPVSTAVNLKTVLLRASRVRAHEKAVINYGGH